MNTRSLARIFVPRPIRNWLRTPSRSAKHVWHRIQFASGHTGKVAVRKDWAPACHPAACSHFEVFRSDPVQSEELDTFIAECPEGIQLLDVGAHYGFFALAALRYGGPETKVVCVEASPSAAKVLRSNIQLNHAQENVQLLNVALGDDDGMLAMLTTGPLAGDYFIVPTETRSDTTMVPQRSLASLLEETQFRPTHIKMDIESFEFEVIEAAINVLRTLRPVLFLELHGDALHARKKDPAQVIQNLCEAGYNEFKLSGQPISVDDMAAKGFNCRITCSIKS